MATAPADAQQSGIWEHEGKIPSGEVEDILVDIQKLLEKAPTKECHYIHRISSPIRDLNEESYTPKFVAIGPYHHEKPPKAGEAMKSHYLQLVLNEKTMEERRKIITEMISLREKARKCYDAESIRTISDREFLKMMLFDSCLVVEIIRRFHAKEGEEMQHEQVFDDDPIFIDETTRNTVWRDLVLFENQLPFFVLQRFYDLTPRPQSGPDQTSGTQSGPETKSDFLQRILYPRLRSHSGPETKSDAPFSKMAMRFVGNTIPGPYCDLPGGNGYEPKHLLGQLYDSLARINPSGRRSGFGPCDKALGLCCFFLGGGCLAILLMVPLLPWTIFLIFKALLIKICKRKSPPSVQKFELISCSTRLLEKGVKFRKMEMDEKWTPTIPTQGVDNENNKKGSLFDVEFAIDDGTLRVPTLEVNSNTKAVFLNLLAYERYCRRGHQRYVRDYMALMDCLIDTSEDVEILCKRGIFKNSSQSYKEIRELFDRPKDDFINIDPKNFVYEKTFKSINCYCNQCWTRFAATWSKWMAKLKAKYFDSPWTLISLLAATILLALTVIQTVYTLLSYYH